MNGHVHAFIWSAATGPIDIGLPAGAIDTRAMTISAAGQVTGVATVNGQNQSFVST